MNGHPGTAARHGWDAEGGSCHGRPPPAAVSPYLVGALLCALTLLAYLPALHAGFIWDDDDYVTANHTLRSLDGLRRIWVQPGVVPQYYPLTFTSLWATYQLWGTQPFPHHLINVLLHALNAVLLWRILRRLEVPAAWMAAAVFALHPMMVESVAWVTERKNVLSGACALAATLVWVRDARRTWRAYAAVVALFVAALLSKSVACTLPVVLATLDWWRGTLDRRAVLRLAPLVAIGLAVSALTVWLEHHRVGAEGSEWNRSLLERTLIAGRIVWFYPRSLLWPRDLTFIYPRWTVDTRVWWQYLPTLAAAAVVALLYGARRRIGSGAFVAVLAYVVMLAPALGFFDVYPMRYSFVADHFAYLPSTALIALAVATGAALVERPALAGRRRQWALCAPVLVALAWLTARQCGVYRDPRTLWTDTVGKNPDCWLAHNNLGVILLQEGDVDAAAAHFSRALQAKPDYREALINLGNTFRSRGKLEEATRLYAEAVERYPESTSAHTALAIALAETGNLEDAISHLHDALRLDLANAQAHATLAQLLQRQGHLEQAVPEAAAAAQLQPDSAIAQYTLARALAAQGRTADAAEHYAAVVRLLPAWAEAQYDLATLLLSQGRLDEAKTHFVAAIELKPDSAEAHSNLCYLFRAQGHPPEAIAECRQALRIKPDYPEAHTNLGVALADEGKTAEAIAEYEAALRVKPEHAAAHRYLGIALARQGETTRAITELEATLRLSPGDREAERALTQLRPRSESLR